MLPSITLELARRIEQTDIDYAQARLESMQRAPGNPLGVEIARFGQALAFAVPAWPDFWYGNKVLNLGPEDAGQVELIDEFFRGRGLLGYRYEFMPGMLDARLGSCLHQLGFTQTGFNTALYGTPEMALAVAKNAPVSERVQVRQPRPGELGRFMDLYQDGFELPRLQGEERRGMCTWLECAGERLRLCLAELDGEGAGIGVLFIRYRVGLLADASVLPAYRGLGCHTALLRCRLEQAADYGCDLLSSFVEFGSQSHRNLARLGMSVAYTKAVWRRAGNPRLP